VMAHLRRRPVPDVVYGAWGGVLPGGAVMTRRRRRRRVSDVVYGAWIEGIGWVDTAWIEDGLPTCRRDRAPAGVATRRQLRELGFAFPAHWGSAGTVTSSPRPAWSISTTTHPSGRLGVVRHDHRPGS
jgi:hypothetical protein